MLSMTPEMFNEILFGDKEKVIESLKRAEKAMRKEQPQNVKKLINFKVIKPNQEKEYLQKHLAYFVACMVELYEDRKAGNKLVKDKVVFLTADDYLIKKRKELEQTFDIMIKTPEESIPMMEKMAKESDEQDKKNRSYIG